MTAGHRSYRQVKQLDGTSKLVEIMNPSPRISEDLRFDGNFVSPVDGTEIRSKRELNEHNQRHKVTQVLPGMGQDMASIRKANRDAINGDTGRQERIRDILKAVEQGERNA